MFLCMDRKFSIGIQPDYSSAYWTMGFEAYYSNIGTSGGDDALTFLSRGFVMRSVINKQESLVSNDNAIEKFRSRARQITRWLAILGTFFIV